MISMNGGHLSPQAKARLAHPSSDHSVPDLSDLAAVRLWRAEQHASWGENVVEGEPVHEPAEIGGVSCLVAGHGPTVVYAHGGGFCLGSPGTVIPITSRLATRTRVVSVGYRLAPEHPFPAAIDDVVSVVEAEAARISAPVTVAGDSAGGCLAVAAARWAPELVGGLVLLSPVLDLRGPPPSVAPLFAAYVAGKDRSAPEVSVLSASSLADLPPTLLQATSTEALYPQAAEFAGRTSATTFQVWDGLWHGWHYHRDLPEARDAVDRAATWVSARA